MSRRTERTNGSAALPDLIAFEESPSSSSGDGGAQPVVVPAMPRSANASPTRDLLTMPPSMAIVYWLGRTKTRKFTA